MKKAGSITFHPILVDAEYYSTFMNRGVRLHLDFCASDLAAFSWAITPYPRRTCLSVIKMHEISSKLILMSEGLWWGTFGNFIVNIVIQLFISPRYRIEKQTCRRSPNRTAREKIKYLLPESPMWRNGDDKTKVWIKPVSFVVGWVGCAAASWYLLAGIRMNYYAWVCAHIISSWTRKLAHQIRRRSKVVYLDRGKIEHFSWNTSISPHHLRGKLHAEGGAATIPSAMRATQCEQSLHLIPLKHRPVPKISVQHQLQLTDTDRLG